MRVGFGGHTILTEGGAHHGMHQIAAVSEEKL